jgi:catalase
MVTGVEDLSNRLVDALLRDFPHHVEGTRPVHSKGIGVRGHFQPSEVAADYCAAELFKGQVPVTVRFSNSSGHLSPDFDRDMRGMAVKFHPPYGDAETDLIAITVPVAPTRTAKDFLAFAAAAVPAPAGPVSPLRAALDLLALRTPFPKPAGGSPTSVEQNLFRFGMSHPEALPWLLAVKSAITPLSYAQAAYHAVHAFRITGPYRAVRSVRFHWDPLAGVKPVPREDLRGRTYNYLRMELKKRLKESPVEFILRMQVAEIGDDTSDPTKAWPWRRRLIDMGTLSLFEPIKDDDTERLSFNPTRLAEGIACSDDEILRARGPAYQASWERRAGNDCPFS